MLRGIVHPSRPITSLKLRSLVPARLPSKGGSAGPFLSGGRKGPQPRREPMILPVSSSAEGVHRDVWVSMFVLVSCDGQLNEQALDHRT